MYYLWGVFVVILSDEIWTDRVSAVLFAALVCALLVRVVWRRRVRRGRDGAAH